MILSDIRKQARESLTGKWGKSALIILIYFLFSFALGFIKSLVEDISFLSFVVEIGSAIITIPISFGLIISFIKLKRGEEVKCYEFFKYGFANFTRSWKLTGNILLKIWLPILLYVLAIIAFSLSITFGVAGSVVASSSTILILAFIIGIALLVAAFVYLFIKSLLYSFTYFIAYDNEDMSGKEVVEESAKLMKGHRGKYILLQLSFIGWIILSVFTLYIGMLWIFPYMQISMICFYEALKENKVEE